MRILESLSVPSSCTDCSAADSSAAASSPTGVSRRTALGNGMLTAIAAVLGAPLLDACASHGTSQRATLAAAAQAFPIGHWMLRVRAADYPALAAVGGIARVDDGSDKPVAVVRTAAGYSAFSLRCPHAGGTLDPVDGGFLCPNHGAKFAADGSWVGGRAAKNLKVLEVAVDAGTGVLTIIG
jgi:Rieske Fe-S protein